MTVTVTRAAAPRVTVTRNQILVTVAPIAAGAGAGSVTSVNGSSGDVTVSTTSIGAQPVDSDLTAIAALSTTAFGRGLLTAADAAALRLTAGLGTAATFASGDFDAAGAAATALTSAQSYADSAVSSEASARNTAISTAINNLIAAAPGTLDTLDELAAALGDDPNFAATITTALAGKQPLDSDLTAIAALATTTFGRALLTLSDAAALRSTAGLGGAATLNVGTSAGTVAAGDDSRITGAAQKSSNLSDLASASTARTNLGLGTLAVASPGNWKIVYTDGSGAATALALGSAGSVLTSNGASSAPSWGAVPESNLGLVLGRALFK